MIIASQDLNTRTTTMSHMTLNRPYRRSDRAYGSIYVKVDDVTVLVFNTVADWPSVAEFQEDVMFTPIYGRLTITLNPSFNLSNQQEATQVV